MLVTPSEFQAVAMDIAGWSEGGVAFDLETDGLRVRQGAKAFLLGIAYRKGETLHQVSVRLDGDRVTTVLALRKLFSNDNVYYAAHNAKFEMSFLRKQFGVEIFGKIWDTEIFARTVHNKHLGYSLQKCAEREGLTKYQPMLDWLKKNKKHEYHLAPEEIIVPYVEQDALLSLILMEKQQEVLYHWERRTPVPIAEVVRLEMRTTKELFELEDVGLHVDVTYCREALDYERNRVQEAEDEFERLTAREFIDSRKALQPIFEEHGIGFGKTEKGNASFASGALDRNRDSAIVACLLRHRDAAKRASTYWANFLHLHVDGRIYPNIRQTGADTFRMSITDPAAQTWPDDSEDPDQKFPVRRAFIPAYGCKIVSFDYQQMELRLMADEAGEMEMIEAFKQGVDFHQRVADEAGVKRGIAKNARFAKLYGAGVARIATTLGVPLEVAKKVVATIDKQSPQIKAYTRRLINHAQYEGSGYNWMGRRYFFDKGWEYKFPNYRIQGGCAEILRIAICDLGEFLRKNRKGNTYMMLPIHDEILFNWDPVDDGLLPEVRRIMIAAHRSKKHLDMEVSCAQGPNFHDMTEVKL